MKRVKINVIHVTKIIMYIPDLILPKGKVAEARQNGNFDAIISTNYDICA